MALISTVTIHMVCSLDGYIAKPDGDVSWMHSTDKFESGVVLTEEYITDFLSRIDCYIMGSKTYEHALKVGWPYGDTPVKVVTRRNLEVHRKTVEFHSGDISHLVADLRSRYANIWMVGGSKLTSSFLTHGLGDELVVTIVPVLLGAGTSFFEGIERQFNLHLKDCTAFSDGMVELHYQLLSH